MANNFYSWFVDKLRMKRYGMNVSQIKMLTFGALYYGSYSNWKHDPNPLIFCMYSDNEYTHGINTHYLKRSDKEWLGRLIYLIKKAGQNIDPLTFYHLLKQRRKSVVNIAYRLYHTNLLNMKLVSAGITPLDELIYTISRDPWVNALNEMIKPSEMKRLPTKIAFDPEELRERIITASNAIDIRTKRVGPVAPYVEPSPFIRTIK